MLDQSIRSAILVLHQQRHSIRAIARAVGVSRNTVNRVLAAGSPAVPEFLRPEKAEVHREEILELLPACKGNLVRVHEKLLDRGAVLSYQALTGFCRRHGIGFEPPKPAGQYHFEPGEEMQHDMKKYHDLRAALLKDGRYGEVRYLDPDNKKSSKKPFFNPSILQELDKHYTRK